MFLPAALKYISQSIQIPLETMTTKVLYRHPPLTVVVDIHFYNPIRILLRARFDREQSIIGETELWLESLDVYPTREMRSDDGFPEGTAVGTSRNYDR